MKGTLFIADFFTLWPNTKLSHSPLGRFWGCVRSPNQRSFLLSHIHTTVTEADKSQARRRPKCMEPWTLQYDEVETNSSWHRVLLFPLFSVSDTAPSLRRRCGSATWPDPPHLRVHRYRRSGNRSLQQKRAAVGPQEPPMECHRIEPGFHEIMCIEPCSVDIVQDHCVSNSTNPSQHTALEASH